MKNIVVLFKRVVRVITRRGVFWGVSRSVSYIFKKNHGESIDYQKGKEFDQKYSVDTAVIIDPSQYKIKSKNWIYASRYEGIPPDKYELILSELEIKYSDFTFIDIGAGKGRAMLIASKFPFKKIIGVEFCKELVEIAESNIKIFPKEEIKCVNISIHCLDAVEFEFPNTPLFLFLFNPFEIKVMEKFIHNLEMSYEQSPRRIIVIYISGRCEFLWDKVSFLNKKLLYSSVRIYDTLK